MKKIIKWIVITLVLIIILIALAGMYKFNYLASQPGYDCDGNKIEVNIENTNTGEFVNVPEFRIAVQLSESAKQKLAKLDETIKVIAHFDGDGEKNVGENTAPFRDVYMGSVEKKIKYGEVAIFNDVKLPKKDFDRLFSEDYYVTINVVSGREKHEDNLLDTTIYIEPISFFVDKEITVEGKLIYE